MLIQNPKCAMMRQICQPKASDRAGNFTFDRRLNIKDAINDCSEMVIMNVNVDFDQEIPVENHQKSFEEMEARQCIQQKSFS